MRHKDFLMVVVGSFFMVKFSHNWPDSFTPLYVAALLKALCQEPFDGINLQEPLTTKGGRHGDG